MNEINFNYNHIFILSLISISLYFIFSKIKKEMNKSKLYIGSTERMILQKEFEYEMKRKNKEIVDEQHERLGEMKRLGEFGKLAQGLFHDLMTPFNAVILYIESIANDKELPNAGKNLVLNDAKEAAKRMARYLDTIRSSISKPNTERMCSIDEEIGNVIFILSYRIKENNIKVKQNISKDYLWFGNPTALEHVFYNIISNAIDSFDKSNNANKTIEINGVEIGDNYHLSFSDNGVGIDKDIIDKIFDPFFSTKDKNKGMGIGLTIVKSIIIDKLKGKIDVVSKDHKTVFTIILPK